MKKLSKKIIKGIWIGALIGLIISIIDVTLGLLGILTFRIYVNYPSGFMINTIFHLTSLISRIVVGTISNILVYGILGGLISFLYIKLKRR